jgi:DNA-binding transcriptional LysR family regulator
LVVARLRPIRAMIMVDALPASFVPGQYRIHHRRGPVSGPRFIEELPGLTAGPVTPADTLGEVEMREIEAFLAVTDELHFGRAAARLRLTTGRVSQSVRALEREVGASLFERTSRRVALTPLGAAFAARVRPAYEELGAALAEARQARGMPYRDLLRAQFASSLPPDVAPRLSAAFARNGPGCRLSTVTRQLADLLRWLNSGQLDADVAIGWFPDPDAGPRPVPDWVELGPVLLRAPRAVLVSQRHPLAGRSSLDAEELAGHTVIRTWAPAGYADGWSPPVTPGGKPIRRSQQTRPTYVEDLTDLLSDGTLLHLTVPQLAPDDGLVLIPLTGLAPVVCALAWPRDSENPWITRFAEVAAAEYATV